MIAALRRPFRSWFVALFLGAAVVGLLPTSAWAQAKKGAKEPTPEELKGYTMPYFFTAIGVLAVTTMISWPANRKWDVKLTDDDE